MAWGRFLVTGDRPGFADLDQDEKRRSFMHLARAAFSRTASAARALALAALLTGTGAASARPPLIDRLFPRPAYDPEAYIRDSAVLPSYYWSVSKFDRANAGAFGPFTPRPWSEACAVDALAPTQSDDARNVVAPAPPASPRQP
jgi:hypothetical protein